MRLHRTLATLAIIGGTITLLPTTAAAGGDCLTGLNGCCTTGNPLLGSSCPEEREIIIPTTTTEAPATTEAPTTVAPTTAAGDQGAAAPTTAAPELPATGNGDSTLLIAGLLSGLGVVALAATRRRQLG